MKKYALVMLLSFIGLANAYAADDNIPLDNNKGDWIAKIKNPILQQNLRKMYEITSVDSFKHLPFYQKHTWPSNSGDDATVMRLIPELLEAFERKAAYLRRQCIGDPEKLIYAEKFIAIIQEEFEMHLLRRGPIETPNESLRIFRTIGGYDKNGVYRPGGCYYEACKIYNASKNSGFFKNIAIRTGIAIPVFAASVYVINKYAVPFLDRYFQKKKWTNKSRKRAIVGAKIGSVVVSTLLGLATFILIPEKFILSQAEIKNAEARTFVGDKARLLYDMTHSIENPISGKYIPL